MQFTPQQLTGGPKYHHRTRIGNWNEDQELDEIQLKNFLAQKESGGLIVTAKQQQLEECLQPVELSDSADGCLRFGQRAMLFSQQALGFLSVNPYESVSKTSEAFTMTTSRRSGPSVRNAFFFERVSEDDGFDDDAVHYGQEVRFALAPFCRKMPAPAYLHSEMVTALAAAKFSRHQEVTSLSERIGETKWKVLYPDVNQRFEMDGEPVLAGSPVVLQHVQTGSFLASDDIPYHNIFGQENEVHCHHYLSLNKTQNLTSEKKGDITGDYALRRQGLPNIWTVRTATHGGEDFQQ
uniref:MIR domain-containing protein n=1 Tax=Zooxanthella nutricula TaxID=1333877 RepID=A0A7S2QFJ9_9DINO|mmetsp:Transcript_8911/g.26579  ORF Transcript_8911/g.26579 Transcript_8911/m.26579 type:complete len:294 (+) Transcript_8911:160-1041(+)